jgi:hypothetical protein
VIMSGVLARAVLAQFYGLRSSAGGYRLVASLTDAKAAS